jgi:hypothetical protein
MRGGFSLRNPFHLSVSHSDRKNLKDWSTDDEPRDGRRTKPPDLSTDRGDHSPEDAIAPRHAPQDDRFWQVRPLESEHEVILPAPIRRSSGPMHFRMTNPLQPRAARRSLVRHCARSSAERDATWESCRIRKAVNERLLLGEISFPSKPNKSRRGGETE